ncbi:MAG: hypothetical protein C5B57_12530 [Blastocatellia bacterium]|nr:MAG: hypothetical protein C5B57_12530 [Blastocatellia bacterium]
MTQFNTRIQSADSVSTVSSRPPAAIIVALFLAYLIFVARIPLPGLRRHSAFDPLAARPHAVESLIVAKEYAAALPLALELRRSFPDEPQLIYWIAVIQRGLHDWSAEAQALEEYVRASATPEEACPALPEAYSHLGAASEALTAYERCLQFDPSDPDRLIDLAIAYERSERVREAIALYRRAAALDPFNPVLASRLSPLSEGTR